MTILEIVIFVAFAVPFIIYPGVLLAGAMSLGATRQGSKKEKKRLTVKQISFLSFVWLSILYPVVYYICYLMAEKNAGFSYLSMSVLFGYLISVLVLYKLSS